MRSYSDYATAKVLEEYVGFFNRRSSHPWTLAMFLKKLKAHLDSIWVTEVVDGYDDFLLHRPLDSCEVRFLVSRIKFRKVYRRIFVLWLVSALSAQDLNIYTRALPPD